MEKKNHTILNSKGEKTKGQQKRQKGGGIFFVHTKGMEWIEGTRERDTW